MEEINPYAPPESEVEVILESGAIWRKEKLLVMRKNAELPGRCIYCNQSARLSKQKRINYLNIWLKIALILLFLIFNVLALIPILIIVLYFRKSGKIRIPLCQKHRKRRILLTSTSLAMLFISVGLSFVAAKTNGYYEPYFVISLGFFLVAFALAIIRGQLLRAKKIDAEKMILKGAKAPFLDSLAKYSEQ